MTTLSVDCESTQKRSAIAAAATTQGRWGYFSASDTATGDPKITPVASYTNAQLNRGKLYPMWYEPHKREDISGIATIATATRVTIGVGPNVRIEDDNLASRVSGDFGSATPGDLMVLNVTGYPTLDGAGDDPGASATPVAVFVRKTGNTIVYRTI